VDEYRFTRRHLEKLVDGKVYSKLFDPERHRTTWELEDENTADPKTLIPPPQAMWAGLLSTVESTGEVESEGAMLVMDLERSLHLLARQHPEAAAVISARVMCDFEDDEMDGVFPKGYGRPAWQRLRSKGIAWMQAYLNGHPITAPKGKSSCESAYGRAG
jgi:hypothetical protein